MTMTYGKVVKKLKFQYFSVFSSEEKLLEVIEFTNSSGFQFLERDVDKRLAG